MYYSSPLIAVLTPKSVIQLAAFIAFETGRKLNSLCCILLLVPLQTYIWQKKNKKKWALLTDLLKVKNNMFLPENCHTQKRKYSLNTHPLDVSRGNLNMAMVCYRLQIYLWKDCWAIAIQECYYFNWVWVHWGSVQFLQIIFSFSDILIYL